MHAIQVSTILINCLQTVHFYFSETRENTTSVLQNAIKKDIVFHFHVEIKAISANFRLTSYRCSIISVTILYQYLLK